MNRIALALALTVTMIMGCGSHSDSAAPEAQRVTAAKPFDQGWSAQTQERARFTGFGSRLLPYAWLLQLERADGTGKLVSDASMRRLGFLTASPSATNPDGLPIGMTRARDANGMEWAGLGCAACHTGAVRYRGRTVPIDGGAGLLDFQGFEQALVDSLSATLANDVAFARFADALGTPASARLDLKNAMVEQTQRLTARRSVNATQVAYGHARLDAFGQIFNAVAVDFLGIPSNRHSPDAPVSFPQIWDAPHLDRVQWNASAPNANAGPLFQNVTTALAVYGHAQLDGHDGLAGYPSTADFKALGEIGQWVYALRSPQWDASWLGALNAARVERGRALHAQHCASCHQPIQRDDPAREPRVATVAIEEIGTDPAMARNFLDRRVATGMLEGRHQAVVAGEKFGAEASSIDTVVHVAIGAALRHPLQTVRDAVRDYHGVIKAELDRHPAYYKARPLNGAWTTAPFLHNGSVPTLRQLLTPPPQRVSSFSVGLCEFDPVDVGLGKCEPDASSRFDTRQRGNSNLGHDYGTQLSEQDVLALIEYLKSV